MMQTIIIADSHNLCREALCAYIRQAHPDYVVDDVPDYGGMMGKVKEGLPDLLLVDADLCGGQKESNLDFFGSLPEKVRVGIILPLRHPAFDCHGNICGHFPKSLSCKAFLRGIEQVLDGRMFFPPLDDHIDVGADMFGDADRSRKTPPLTGREKEVLSYLVKGASNKDIARALDLQVVTVKLHVRGICRKLGAVNRTQAALMALENGWG